MELSRDDSTVFAYTDAWRKGSFPSFEEMVCQLAVRLAVEKESLMEEKLRCFRNEKRKDVKVDEDD